MSTRALAMDDLFKIEINFPVISVIHQALIPFTFSAQFPLNAHPDIHLQ